MARALKIRTECYHCGEVCNVDLVFDDKHFCCEGCKVVYQVLNESGLCDYYAIDSRPGLTQSKNISADKYDYLDLEEVESKLLLFRSDKMNKVEFYIPSIHCSSCIWLLENLQRLNQGIISSRVDFVKKKVWINYEPGVVKLSQLAHLLARVGYEPHINLADTDQTKEDSNSKYKKLYIKLGVAGFAFGNIMLMSFPEYFGLSQTNADDLGYLSFFNYLCLILSIPVLVFSASEYIVPAYKSMRSGVLGIDVPISMGIIALFTLSVINIIGSGQAGYLDSFTGLIFFLLLGKVFQEKTYGNLSFERDYTSYFPISVHLVKNGKEIPVMVNDLAEGNIIRVRNGELIPVDSLLISGTAQIDYSFISGESTLNLIKKGERIFAGGRLKGKSIELKVNKDFRNSDIIKLWDNKVFDKTDSNIRIENITNQVSKYFTLAVVLIAVGTLVFWLIRDNTYALNSFTSVLIVACPCALALAAPFTLGAILRVFGRNKFFLRNTNVVEKLSGIDTVVFDKTGTLTVKDENRIQYIGVEPGADQKVLIYSLALQSNHPRSKMVQSYFNSRELDLDEFEEIRGKGIRGSIKGVEVRIGSAEFMGRQKEEGTFIAVDGKVLGKLINFENYRQEVLNGLRKLEVKDNLYVLSGDHADTDHRLTKWFKREKLYFNQSPQDKLEFIEGLSNRKHKVMMIGDGLNDAGALKASHIGIAINDDISNFSPACDAILNGEDFGKLERFMNLARFGKHVIIFCFILSFIYNVVGLSFAMQGVLTPIVSAILMPLSSITVVVIATVFVNVKAKQLKLI